MLIEFLVMCFFGYLVVRREQGAMAIDILQCGTKDLPRAAKLSEII
jgi:TRAP-type C4-dicarboxylate transport system permease small subunit